MRDMACRFLGSRPSLRDESERLAAILQPLECRRLFALIDRTGLFWYAPRIMLMIRFQRIGRKNDPAFRMLVLEKTSGPKAGTYVDHVGSYNPKTKQFSADGEKIKGWMAKGAQVSPSLMNLLITKGVLEGKKSAAVVSKQNLEKNIAKKAAEEAAAKEAADKAAAEAAEKAAAEATAAAEVVEEVAGAPAEEAPTEVAAEEAAPAA